MAHLPGGGAREGQEGEGSQTASLQGVGPSQWGREEGRQLLGQVEERGPETAAVTDPPPPPGGKEVWRRQQGLSGPRRWICRGQDLNPGHGLQARLSVNEMLRHWTLPRPLALGPCSPSPSRPGWSGWGRKRTPSRAAAGPGSAPRGGGRVVVPLPPLHTPGAPLPRGPAHTDRHTLREAEPVRCALRLGVSVRIKHTLSRCKSFLKKLKC